MHREDFEIYEKKEGSSVIYCFDVEYFGHYEASSAEAIYEKLKKIKIKVQKKLEDIEKQNKAYYAKLARQEEQTKSLLKKHREDRSKDVAVVPLSKEETFINKVLYLAKQGYSKSEILKALDKSI